MNLSDPKTIEKLLDGNGVSLKKSLGQNFLIDSSVCPAMAESCCGDTTGVIEIGPGIGVLTTELARCAKRVVAIEIDEQLKKILSKTLDGFENVSVIYGDVMKLDLKKLIEEQFCDCERLVVCANLPYYITSPVIMRLLESRLPLNSITVMVQKEAAERICAEVGSRAAGAVTVAVNYYARAHILFEVEASSFMPPPRVDSAVIQLNIRSSPEFELNDEKAFFSLVKACFAQRRKTTVNTVSNTLGLSKDVLRNALSQLGISETVRSEQLTMRQLSDFSNILFPGDIKESGNL